MGSGGLLVGSVVRGVCFGEFGAAHLVLIKRVSTSGLTPR